MKTKLKPIKEKQKIVNEPIERANPINYTKPTLSFIGSFVIMVGVVLGVYWYGKQVVRSVAVVLRPFSGVSKGVAQTFDPLDLLDPAKKKELMIVDLRSKGEYDKEHVTGAHSLPVYELKNDRMVYLSIDPSALSKLDKKQHIVIYGPSTSFQYQQQIISDLIRQGYSVSQLAIGWNELRHFQNLWIPEGLWGKIDVNSIIENNDIK
ncbi:MAG: rhodanese-like domain-containing protein [Microgenomates group bacterium]